MGVRQYDIIRGGSKVQVVKTTPGAGIATSIVRITVDDANAGTGGKNDILKAIELIGQKIREDNFPLA
jgi:hypothetical protein